MKVKLYFFSKNVKYLGLFSIMALFIDSLALRLMSLFFLFFFVEVALNFAIYKCSILQMIGIIKLDKIQRPSLETFESEVEYILPFKGTWTVVNGCFTKTYSHSWDLPSQRYAYDFIQVQEGQSYKGDLKEVSNYHCYDQEIISPADGQVIEIIDGSEDSIIIDSEKFYSPAKHIAGNYLVIKHAEGEYSFLAHLKKGSILVKENDLVKQGQVIASCGNTGNSTEPHLHFQLQNGPDFYRSLGLPIKFKDFDIHKPDDYQLYDKRPCMEQTDLLDGYITRGYVVTSR